MDGIVSGEVSGRATQQQPAPPLAENTVTAHLMRTRDLLTNTLTIFDELQNLPTAAGDTTTQTEVGVIALGIDCERLAEEVRDRTQSVRGELGRL